MEESIAQQLKEALVVLDYINKRGDATLIKKLIKFAELSGVINDTGLRKSIKHLRKMAIEAEGNINGF